MTELEEYMLKNELKAIFEKYKEIGFKEGEIIKDIIKAVNDTLLPF